MAAIVHLLATIRTGKLSSVRLAGAAGLYGGFAAGLAFLT